MYCNLSQIASRYHTPDVCQISLLRFSFSFPSPCRSKRGLFNRSNWNANMYRSMMIEIVFALYDLIDDDNNVLSKLFAAFLEVYLILCQLHITNEDLMLLHENLARFHRCQQNFSVRTQEFCRKLLVASDTHSGVVCFLQETSIFHLDPNKSCFQKKVSSVLQALDILHYPVWSPFLVQWGSQWGVS